MTVYMLMIFSACLVAGVSCFVLPGPTVEGSETSAKANSSVTARSAQDKFPISVIGTRSTSSRQPPTLDTEKQFNNNHAKVKDDKISAAVIASKIPAASLHVSKLKLNSVALHRRADEAPSRDFDDEEEAPKGREFDFSV